MARRRLRLKRRGPLPFRYVFLITFITFIILTFQGLWIINEGIKPALLNIAEAKTQQIANKAINQAFNKKLAEDLNVDQLVFIEKDSTGKVTSIGWNQRVVSTVLRETTYRVQEYLTQVEEGNIPDTGMPPDIDIEVDDPEKRRQGIVYEMPLGQATNNALLANLGPKVPVRFTAIGSVRPDVREEITSYGINNAKFKVFIHVEVDLRVVIPFAAKATTVSADIPVDIRIIQGDVPYLYNSGGSGTVNPSFIPPKDVR
ncbi:sporulation protein YunB [Bacillus solimangrovi]|uniref:Sporulation protein YunB n=1 Tax=Bacillus solimangrovi TaxID=1305675 RepID=A0A1E5LIP7_9BACI|nr:sporulation protein YunB [Bacillus solimangrovi]OEH93963.1 sporulation protein YunB [Bacillus solimangrovi]